MEENRLEMLWNAHFVDRRVKKALQDMFSTTDRALIRIIRSREPKLTPKGIQESLRRLDVRIESSTPVPEPVVAVREQHPGGSRLRVPKRAKGGWAKHRFGVKLRDVINAKLLNTPLRLFRKYKGSVLEATLHPDGTIEFQGKRHSSCSTAAEIARGTVTGRRMNTNGWMFWQYRDGQGKTRELSEARQSYLESRGQG
jgi:hypothetical protein